MIASSYRFRKRQTSIFRHPFTILLPPQLSVLPVVAADSLQSFQHDHGVATDDHHAEPNLLAAVFLLDRLVQYDVQEDIVSAEYTDDLSASVKLDKQPLVEILLQLRLG